MDCPNCGAYNASNSIRCRRCNGLLPGADENASDDSEWGPASGPEHRWDEHFRDSQSREDAEHHEPEPEPEPESWTTPEPEPRQPSDWDIAQPGGSGTWESSSELSSPSPSSSGTYAGDVPNYLWPSIAATLCCCAPLGIPAIIYASRVDAFAASGNRAAAEEASNKAKMFSLAAAGVAVLIWIAIFCTGAFFGEAPA